MQTTGLLLIMVSILLFVIMTWSMRRDYKLMVLASNELRKEHEKIRRASVPPTDVLKNIDKNRERINNIIRQQSVYKPERQAKIIPFKHKILPFTFRKGK